MKASDITVGSIVYVAFEHTVSSFKVQEVLDNGRVKLLENIVLDNGRHVRGFEVNCSDCFRSMRGAIRAMRHRKCQ